MRVEIAPEILGDRGEMAPRAGDRTEIAPEAGDGVEMAPQAPMPPPPPPPSLRVPNYVRDWFQP